jgi:hypothetical protein
MLWVDPANLLHTGNNWLFEAKRAGKPFLVSSAYSLKFILRFLPKSKPVDVNSVPALGEQAAMIRSGKITSICSLTSAGEPGNISVPKTPFG